MIFNRKKDQKIIIGIDEAGRGPLAGPVAVGAFAFINQEETIRKIFSGATDSKKHSLKQREEWFAKIEAEKKNGNLNFSVKFTNSEIIDKKGIVYAIQDALKKALKNLIDSISGISKDISNKIATQEIIILMDGGLKAPKKYINQETIIKGDTKIKEISLASICAKVLRDREMVRISKKYPEYHFDVHKGYGTVEHLKLISKFGPCFIHRKTFLRKIH